MKSTKVLKWGGITVIALGVIGVASVMYIDSAGGRFFDEGRQIKTGLGELAHCLKAKDLAGISDYFADNYSGSPLGFNNLKQTEQKDGIHRLLFTADSSTLN